ncbi:hypothetical protein THAOC_11085 [Thalassiosira oceanica]|uniref:Uncharacterized protein n=1 Tax=Thalassiosira oceanica TaxID=159749 RepID=K0SR04_THAOC|nr:hypothetical protein THAOC_11085 [Thalassiosira oceanica]|eukprot:EJK67820.1 hypothetical protein THAOC_11085 [Thalassiosira oceanica]
MTTLTPSAGSIIVSSRSSPFDVISPLRATSVVRVWRKRYKLDFQGRERPSHTNVTDMESSPGSGNTTHLFLVHMQTLKGICFPSALRAPYCSQVAGLTAAGGPSNRRVLLSRAPQRRETFVDQALMSFTSHTSITKRPV